MTNRNGTLWLWAPRMLGLLVSLFVGLFALDAFSRSTSVHALPDLAVHLAPMLVLLAVVAVSWRWPWVGGVVFTSLAAVYAYVARTHLDWVFAISGPLLIVGLLFVWSGVLHAARLRNFASTGSHTPGSR